MADGTEIELSAGSSDKIMYSVNGGSYKTYDGSPVILNFPAAGSKAVVKAYAVLGGAKGNVTAKTYTKASAQLNDMAVSIDGEKTFVETDGYKSQSFQLADSGSEKHVAFMAQSCDSIFLKHNGTEMQIDSGVWTDIDRFTISTEPGSAEEFSIVVKGSGKNTTEYPIKFYRRIAGID